MKKLYKAALLAALGLASVSAVQAATYNGDLVVGFTLQTGNDLVYDLGSLSSLGASHSWSLGSLFTTTFGGGYDINSLNWGVVGTQVNKQVGYITLGSLSLNQADLNAMYAGAAGLEAGFPTVGAGTHIAIVNSDDNSWNQQTLNGAKPTQLDNSLGNPNLTGTGSSDLIKYLNDTTSSTEGTFTLDGTGTLSFASATVVAVPEPTTYGLLAGAGLLVVSLRKQFRSKNA